MANGDGSIRERKNPKTGKSYNPKRWDVTVSLGFNPATGKQLRKTRRIKGTKADARKVRDEMRAKYSSVESLTADGITFAQYANEWLERRARSGELSARTIAHDRCAVKTLGKAMGDLKLADVNEIAVERALDRITNSKQGRNKERISGTTRHQYFAYTKRILKDAWAKRLIQENPCDRLKAPRKDTREREPLSEEELTKLYEAVERGLEDGLNEFGAKESRMRKLSKTAWRESIRGLPNLSCLMATSLMLATGMRISEVLGLTWNKVNHETFAEIRVWQSLDHDGKSIKDTKTGAGHRTITLGKTGATQLRLWHDLQAMTLKTIGISIKDDSPVLVSQVGGFIDQANYGRWRKKFIEDNGLKPFGAHDLRHAYASQLIAKGMNVKQVQKLLGHESPLMTMNVYAHAMEDGQQEAAEIMEGIRNRKTA